MNSYLKNAVMAVIFLAVWNFCDYLYITMVQENEFQFAVHEHLIQPLVACAILMLMEGYMSRQK